MCIVWRQYQYFEKKKIDTGNDGNEMFQQIKLSKSTGQFVAMVVEKKTP